MDNRRRDRIPHKEWESHKSTIFLLYIRQDLNLVGPDGVIDVMEKSYGFSASKAQFETRLRKWNFRKNVKQGDWRILANIIDSRSQQAKQSQVFLDGKLVSERRIQKETSRYCSNEAIDSPSQVQRLPSRIKVKTPPPGITAITPRPQSILSSSLSIINPQNLHNDSTPAVIPLNANSPMNLSRRYHSEFNIPWNMPNGCATLPSELSFTSMELIPQQNPFDTILEPAQSFPGLFFSIESSVLHMLPSISSLVRSIGVPPDPLLALGKLCQPSTLQILRQQTFDKKLMYLITSRLINNDALDALADPKNDIDLLYKAAVEHLVSLPVSLLENVLKSVPALYSKAFENGVFLAAVELGASPAVEYILTRGLDPDSLKLILKGCPHSPLERSCVKGHVEVVRTLLHFGADPNRPNLEGSLLCLVARMEKDGDLTLAHALQIASLLMNHKATIQLHEVSIFNSVRPEILQLLVSELPGSGIDLFFRAGGLAWILRRDDPNGILFAVTSILGKEYAQGARENDLWADMLTISLSNAAARGRNEAVKLLLDAGARADNNCLINAVQSKDIWIIEHFLELGLDPNTQWTHRRTYGPEYEYYRLAELNEDGSADTASSLAIREELWEVFDIFQERGFFMNVDHSHFKFAAYLEAACSTGREDLVEYLLSLVKGQEHGPGDDLVSKGSALTVAANLGHINIVKKLLAAGVYPNNDALEAAIRHQHYDLINLLKPMVSPEQDTETCEMMHTAVRTGELGIIQELISAGFSLNRQVDLSKSEKSSMALQMIWSNEFSSTGFNSRTPPSWETTPLGSAILNGNHQVIHLLLKSGASVNSRNASVVEDAEIFGHDHVITPLCAAIVKRDFELCEDLFNRGADPFDNDAILVAVQQEVMEALEMIIPAFMNRYHPNTKSFGSVALSTSILMNNMAILEMLAPCADANVLLAREYSFEMISPLGVAITKHGNDVGCSRALHILLKNGGEPNSVVVNEKQRKTALLHAIGEGSLETIKVLVEAGADIAFPAKWDINRTPLQYAAEIGNEDIVQYLLQKGADPNEPPAPMGGATALQLAAIGGHMGIASSLLERKADVNAEPAMWYGRTAFEGAAEHGRIEIILLLMQKGADLLSNDQRQYRQAAKFAEKNAQPAARQLVEKLYEAAIKDQSRDEPVESGGDEAAMVTIDENAFGEVLSSSFGNWLPIQEDSCGWMNAGDSFEAFLSSGLDPSS